MSGKSYRWNRNAFDSAGLLKPEYVVVQDPSNANCGQCHGLVHTDAKTPLSLTAAGARHYPGTNASDLRPDHRRAANRRLRHEPGRQS